MDKIMLAAGLRAGCCDDRPNPCPYHEGYLDGIDVALDEIKILRGLLGAVANIVKGFS